MRCCCLLALVGCGRLAFDPVASTSTTSDSQTGDTLGDGAITMTYRAYIKPHNTEAFDNFGRAIALSADGHTLAVAAPLEDGSEAGGGADNLAPASGAVYVFVRSGTTWVQQAYLKASNAEVADIFGWSVAISSDGNTIAVGAPEEDSSATGINGDGTNNSNLNAGAAYVFGRVGSTWTLQAYVKASNTNAGDFFAETVALSGDGNLLAVGAIAEDSAATGVGGNQLDNTTTNAGAVYTFRRVGTTWGPEYYLKASNPDIDDGFGYSLALSQDGNTLVASASQEDGGATIINGDGSNNSVPEAGAAYVFTWTGTTWVQQAYIKASRIAGGDFVGRFIALSADGNLLACTAPGEDTTVANSGTTYVFERVAATWSEVAALKASAPGDTDQFGIGAAFAAGANGLIVGAPAEDSNASGLDGDATNNASMDSGAAYLYNRNAGTWQPLHYIKPVTNDAGDSLGYAVAVSADRRAIAAGAYQEDSNAVGINGDEADNSSQDSGAVHIAFE